MNEIDTIRAARAKAVDDMLALTNKAAAEGRDFTEEEEAAFKGLQEKDAALGRQIERLESLEKRRAEMAVPVQAPRAPAASAQPPVPAQPKAPAIPGQGFARMVRALAATKGIHRLAAQFAEEQWGPEAADIAAALGSSSGTSGGFLVREQHAAEVIELLRARSVVMRAGARPVPLPGGNLTMPRINTGTAGSYIGENQNATKTEPTFGQVRLTARKLAALVPISNDLIRFASPNVDALVRDDLLAGMQVTMDTALIRDSGTGNAPKGLRYWAAPAASQVIPVNGTVNLANVTADLGKAELALMNANTPMLMPAWLMSPRSLNYLRNLRDPTACWPSPRSTPASRSPTGRGPTRSCAATRCGPPPRSR